MRFTWLQTIVDLIQTELLKVNTYDIGRIVRYDADLQQADVQPVTKTRFRNEAGDDVDETQPVVCNLPVVFPGNGRVVLDWDVRTGDDCEIHYAKNVLDDWFSSGGDNPASSERPFSLSNAICRVGITHFGKPRPKTPGNGVRLRNVDPALGDMRVEIDTDRLAVQVSAPEVFIVGETAVRIQAPDVVVNGFRMDSAGQWVPADA